MPEKGVSLKEGVLRRARAPRFQKIRKRVEEGKSMPPEKVWGWGYSSSLAGRARNSEEEVEQGTEIGVREKV